MMNPIADEYRYIGLAHTVAGMQKAIDILTAATTQMKEQVVNLARQEYGFAKPPVKPRQYRDESVRKSAQGGYWSRMTPEERSAEMARRMAVSRGEEKSRHAKASVRAKIDAKRAETKKRPGPAAGYWAKMTPEERKAEMARRARVSAKRGGLMIGRKGISVRAQAAKRAGASRGGAASPNHPSNPNHPKHAAWSRKMKKINADRSTKAVRETQPVNGAEVNAA